MKSFGLFLLMLLLVFCGSSHHEEDGAYFTPIQIGLSECVVCGMVVREQPAPRGQAVHRDGTRAFFCAIGDMVHYLETPSAHGEIKAIFMEGLSADFDPSIDLLDEQMWYAPDDLVFEVGIKRPKVMGIPVLSYLKEETQQLKPGKALHSWEKVPNLIHQMEGNPRN